jgi:hypothetical protein
MSEIKLNIVDHIIVSCPHCNNYILILKKEFNCKIFRHGVYKNTKKQIDPHLSKVECDRLYNEQLIIGCGKPFEIKEHLGLYKAIKCDYI